MTNPPNDTLGSGLSYEDSLPLTWRRLLPAETAGNLAHVAQVNGEFLRMVTALEEHAPPKTDNHPELAQEILRLESKVNLVLDLLGRLMAHSLKLPPPVRLSLGARSLRWLTIGADVPATGDAVLVEVYLRPEYPRPLTLTGRVRSVDATPAGAKRVNVELEGLTEEVRDWLERMIFRHHRRSVADARRQSDPSSHT
jgi:hypothetical protein